MTTLHRFPYLLLVGDALALLAFVYVGQQDHATLNTTAPLWGLLPTWGSFALVWSVVSVALRAFPSAEGFTPRAFLTRSLNAWLIAGPLGVVARAFITGREAIPSSFFVAALVFGGLFVLGWRAALILGLRRLG